MGNSDYSTALRDQFLPDDKNGTTQQYSQLFSMGYEKKDIMKMKKFYRKIDADNGGSISIAEWCITLKVSKDFGSVLLHLFDEKHDGQITFMGFMVACWNMLAYFDTNALSVIAFQIFDVDESNQVISKYDYFDKITGD